MAQFLKLLFSITPLILSACSTVKILDLNAIPSNNLSIRGLDKAAAPSFRKDYLQNKREVKIVYFHGMGWTQKSTNLAVDFTDGIHNYFDSGGEGLTTFSIAGPCLSDSDRKGFEQSQKGVELSLENNRSYQTDLSNLSLPTFEAGCIDRQVIEPDNSDTRFILYRLFWDNAAWENLQYYHIGYDDSINVEELPLEYRVVQQRKTVNRKLKDQILNHGFGDATLYLGEAGKNLRDVVKATICIAATDSISDSNGFFDEVGNTTSTHDKCSNQEIDNDTPISFIAESLGSRILFDVLKEAHFNRSNPMISNLLATEPEAFLLANQIALIGLGQLKEVDPGAIQEQSEQSDRRAKLIAISEKDDILTYEMVPYVHQLNSFRKQSECTHCTRSFAASNTSGLNQETNLAHAFGFDVVDVRMKFAKPLLGFLPFVADPSDAHTSHAEQELIMQLILCGGHEVNQKTIVNNCKRDKN